MAGRPRAVLASLAELLWWCIVCNHIVSGQGLILQVPIHEEASVAMSSEHMCNSPRPAFGSMTDPSDLVQRILQILFCAGHLVVEWLQHLHELLVT